MCKIVEAMQDCTVVSKLPIYITHIDLYKYLSKSNQKQYLSSSVLATDKAFDLQIASMITSRAVYVSEHQ